MKDIWVSIESQPVIHPFQHIQPKDVKVSLLPFQLEGLNWMMKQEESIYKGGILADEMGMGKTIQMISLLVSRPLSKPTLVICPTVAMMQWMSEIENRVSKDFFKIMLFHGNDRPTCSNILETQDIILTSYSIIENSFRKQIYGFKRKGELVKQNSVIHQIYWGRVVLDEAHNIKDRSCSTARAVFALNRDFQWSMSGTPLQNRVGELYSLIRFMDLDPFSYYFCKVW